MYINTRSGRCYHPVSMNACKAQPEIRWGNKNEEKQKTREGGGGVGGSGCFHLLLSCSASEDYLGVSNHEIMPAVL